MCVPLELPEQLPVMNLNGYTVMLSHFKHITMVCRLLIWKEKLQQHFLNTKYMIHVLRWHSNTAI